MLVKREAYCVFVNEVTYTRHYVYQKQINIVCGGVKHKSYVRSGVC